MTSKFNPAAVVFDLDGTLVDSATDIVAALDAVLVEFGRPPVGQAVGRGMIGDGARVLIERGFAATGGAPADPELAFRRWLDVYSANIARNSRPYPGVMDTLSDLSARGKKLAVCTNKADGPTHQLLKETGLSKWFDVVVGGDVPHRKPDPRHLQAAIAPFGIAPADALMVGDSPNDAKSARAAGMPLVLVDYGYTQIPVAELGADAVLSDIAELRRIVA